MHTKVYFIRSNRKKRHCATEMLLFSSLRKVSQWEIFKLQEVKQLFSLFSLNAEDTHASVNTVHYSGRPLHWRDLWKYILCDKYLWHWKFQKFYCACHSNWNTGYHNNLLFKLYAQGYALPFLRDFSQLQRGFETTEVNEALEMDKCTPVTPTWSVPGTSAQQEYPLGGDIWNNSNGLTNH